MMTLKEIEVNVLKEALTEYKYFLKQNANQNEPSEFAKKRNEALEFLLAEIKCKSNEIRIVSKY
jgi:hypothetical protein